MGHFAACIWIQAGQADKYLPKEEQQSWLYVNDFDSFDDNDTSPLKNNVAMYIFSYYWCFTVMTTVGYGDYSGGTTREYLLSLLLEFVGFCYNAILISIMSSFFASEISFDDLLTARMSEMELWMNRIQLSYKPNFLHPKLGKKI